MNQEITKAILVVSFGTSHNDTREVTIDAIEHDIAAAYPDFKVYRAWTSKMIIKKIFDRDGIHISNVREAMEQMIHDGISELIVQPTHVINGIENDLMKEDVLSYSHHFSSIRFGAPLLTSTRDNNFVVDAIAEDLGSSLRDDEVLILMGHGTTHYANTVYAALDYTFKDRGYSRIFLGTVEAYPSMESLLRQVKLLKPRRAVLAPFMIVAGDHAKNDMAGKDPDSWKCQFEQAGIEVSCVLKGLGEYPKIRQLFLEHIRESA
ncbi:MAG: sirohydrochlorin cobaltochelatase [Lachnospiraceae bacterium]|nr:sirohydrochlorin cobaltochelatase [Robinsoniella sp.]MDY3766775.1 sirohydrochlorin cobaltochelatase [Lachnospiraceae bacterium]